jgi:hypothetical protein
MNWSADGEELMNDLRTLASNFIRSRAFRMAAGSYVFLVVLTVIEPSTKSSVHAIPCFSSCFVMNGHDPRRYCSRYLGKSVEKELSSKNVPPKLSSGANLSIFHLSISSVSLRKQVSKMYTQ